MKRSAGLMNEVKEKLRHADNLIVEEADVISLLPVIAVKNPDRGIDVLVYMQDAGSYGELPLTTTFQLEEIQEKYPNILLVSFSKVSGMLMEALDDMHIPLLIDPTAETLFSKINEMVMRPFVVFANAAG